MSTIVAIGLVGAGFLIAIAVVAAFACVHFVRHLPKD